MYFTVGDVDGFPYLTHASCFSFVVVMLWAHGCAILPSLRFEVPNSGAHD
jgi:hypothetical protein